MSVQLIDREEIYDERYQRFLKAIEDYETEELKKITQKTKDEIEFEMNKIRKDAREKDEEVFSKKHKSIEVESKICRSRKINEMRLSKMKLRFEMIEKIQAEVNSRLLEKLRHKGDYRTLLKDLLLQGMIKMLEEEVEIKCLSRDVELVKEAAVDAKKEFHQMCEVKTNLKISHESLPDSELGGIVLTSFRGKIVCSNTLKARLEYALQLSLPNIRHMLFGGEK